jgi:hypothetical protein
MHVYNFFASSTYIANGSAISSDTLGLNTSGFLSQDDFHISQLTVKELLFEEATSRKDGDCTYCGPEIDTVLPLGPYNASSARNFRSPIARTISSNLLDENIFSLRLSRGANDGLGQLVLGGVVDETSYDGNFVRIPVTPHTAEFAEDDK